MPAQTSARSRETQRLNKLMEDIFNRERRIRFVAVYQDQYLLAGGMRPGSRSHDPVEEAHEVDMQLSKMGEIARSWQRWFGQLESFVLRYERITLAFHPLGEGRFLVLSCEPDFDASSIASIVTPQGYRILQEDIP